MARRCKITGKKPLTGNNVSHANNKTKRRQMTNLQNKRVFVPELGRWVRIRMTSSAMRTINKVGLLAYLKKQGIALQDIAN